VPVVSDDFNGGYSVTFDADWPALHAAIYQFGHLSTAQNLPSNSDVDECSVNSCQSPISSSFCDVADDVQVTVLWFINLP